MVDSGNNQHGAGPAGRRTYLANVPEGRGGRGASSLPLWASGYSGLGRASEDGMFKGCCSVGMAEREREGQAKWMK